MAGQVRERAAVTAESVAIRLESCTKTFPDGTVAVEPLDLAIAAGETLVLLGPSGCGKTTTLRMIAGLERPDPGGRVLFGAEDVTALPIERRKVGMVFQSYALFPNMSVAENIAYGLKVSRTPEAARRERVGEMLAMMRIEPLADRRIDQLSGGQKQRVALARAIAVRPRVLLLDEPLTALDAKLRDQLRIEIDGLLRSLAITTVYVTHDQGEAMALADRIVVMSQGRVAQIGTPREIYHRPQSRFVADFIGTMNRLIGRSAGGILAFPGGAISWNGRPGERIEVLCRPADFAVATEGAGVLRGRVTAALFLGDRTRLVIEDVGDAPVIVETGERRVFTLGETIGLTVDPASLLVLEDPPC